MSTTLPTTLPDYLRDLRAGEDTDLATLSGASLVVISSVRFTELTGYEAVRFQACLRATRAYARAGVIQLVMVDPASDHHVAAELARHGAIVVATPRSGLARPYLDAARLVQFHAGPQAYIVKAEGDKAITGSDIAKMGTALKINDVVVGDRSAYSMASMTPIQQRTEADIDAALAMMLGLPHGLSFGVQGYAREGIGVLLGYEEHLASLGDNWKYLLYTPAIASMKHLTVGGVTLDVQYDPSMVAAEAESSVQTLKRLEQVLTMVEGALEVVGLVYAGYYGYRPPTKERLQEAAAQVTALRLLVNQPTGQ